MIKNLYENFSVTNEGVDLPFNIDRLVNKALKDIFGGATGVNKSLYDITAQTLKDAIGSSITLEYNVPNQTLINQLQTNANVFAAFKSHQQSEAIQALLTDNGEVVPWKKFRDEALKISEKYNKQWLKTEYNTALRRGSMADRFTTFVNDADLYPNLRWLPSTSSQPTEEHKAFYYIVRAVGDAFWVNHCPGMRWNCACGIEQTKDGTTDLPTELPEPPPGLEGNPYFTKEIIGSKHPYYEGLNKKETTAVMDMVKKDVETTTNKWAKDNLKGDGLVITNDQLKATSMLLNRAGVKALALVDDHFLKTYPTLLADDVDNWTYKGHLILDPKTNAGANRMNCYETNYGDKIYINTKVIDDVEKPFEIVTKLPTNLVQ